MSRNQKIDKINAYKKMLEQKRLPKVEERAAESPAELSVEEQIHAEFAQWAEGQLAELLGEGRPVEPSTADVFDVFSDEQIDVLQTFANKMLNKATTPTPPPQAPQQNRTGTNEGYRSPREVKPLGNRRMDQDAKKAKAYDKETNKLLTDLEKMDREGPQY